MFAGECLDDAAWIADRLGVLWDLIAIARIEYSDPGSTVTWAVRVSALGGALLNRSSSIAARSRPPLREPGARGDPFGSVRLGSGYL